MRRPSRDAHAVRPLLGVVQAALPRRNFASRRRRAAIFAALRHLPRDGRRCDAEPPRVRAPLLRGLLGSLRRGPGRDRMSVRRVPELSGRLGVGRRRRPRRRPRRKGGTVEARGGDDPRPSAAVLDVRRRRLAGRRRRRGNVDDRPAGGGPLRSVRVGALRRLRGRPPRDFLRRIPHLPKPRRGRLCERGEVRGLAAPQHAAVPEVRLPHREERRLPPRAVRQVPLRLLLGLRRSGRGPGLLRQLSLLRDGRRRSGPERSRRRRLGDSRRRRQTSHLGRPSRGPRDARRHGGQGAPAGDDARGQGEEDGRRQRGRRTRRPVPAVSSTVGRAPGALLDDGPAQGRDDESRAPRGGARSTPPRPRKAPRRRRPSPAPEKEATPPSGRRRPQRAGLRPPRRPGTTTPQRRGGGASPRRRRPRRPRPPRGPRRAPLRKEKSASSSDETTPTDDHLPSSHQRHRPARPSPLAARPPPAVEGGRRPRRRDGLPPKAPTPPPTRPFGHHP
mmetsp:Transcript_6904/g.22344  ORF Transcript_6904/g.22344 Transcript_6904/m.22344 type:complete len:503 (-) Transcript_6904:1215-2723(-)